MLAPLEVFWTRVGQDVAGCGRGVAPGSACAVHTFIHSPNRRAKKEKSGVHPNNMYFPSSSRKEIVRRKTAFASMTLHASLVDPPHLPDQVAFLRDNHPLAAVLPSSRRTHDAAQGAPARALPVWGCCSLSVDSVLPRRCPQVWRACLAVTPIAPSHCRHRCHRRHHHHHHRHRRSSRPRRV